MIIKNFIKKLYNIPGTILLKLYSYKIDYICNKYGISNYEINRNRSIDVNGDVVLSWYELNKLPLKFNKVSGHFSCNGNKLKSLIGCPIEVGGDFSCVINQLTSLVGSPNKVGGYFDCSKNKLTTLMGGPEIVGGEYNCNFNELTSLVGSAIEIGGVIYYHYNLLHPFYNQAYNELNSQDLLVFIKYAEYYEIFLPVFNKQNGLDLINDIRSGLK